MKKKYKIILPSVLLILAAVTVYLFLWGRLFLFSPVVIGFDKHELNRCIYYVQDGANFNDFIRIDTLLSGVENEHRLKFKQKPNIYIFSSESSYISSSGSRARFCTFPIGSIVVAPWAMKEINSGKISLEIYMRHELSHALIFNYTGILRGLRFPPWLMEGIAMYTAKQAGTGFYPGKDETYKLIRQGNFLPPGYYNTEKEDQVKLNVKYKAAFKYSEFSFIVDYLIRKYGRQKFQQYMEVLFQSSDYRNEFKEIFNIDFDEAIEDFKQVINNNIM